MVSAKQKKNTPKMKDADGNEIEMPNMATMNILMPLMSGWISFSVPQGMGLYWFCNGFLQVIIQLVTDKFITKNDEKSSNGTVIEPVEAVVDEDIIKEESKGPNPNQSKKKKKNKKKK
jgi:YidC/Oxa1 family membrane protein insertase